MSGSSPKSFPHFNAMDHKAPGLAGQDLSDHMEIRGIHNRSVQ